MLAVILSIVALCAAVLRRFFTGFALLPLLVIIIVCLKTESCRIGERLSENAENSGDRYQNRNTGKLSCEARSG